MVKLFPNARARYKFINYGKHFFPEGFGENLRRSVDSMAGLCLSNEEKEFLRKNCPYLDPTYEIVATNKSKFEKYNDPGVTVADFGTRRRYSYHVQQKVIEALTRFGGKSFVGTSNVHLAMLYNTRPIGTHAHEWFMFHAARYGFKMANAMSLEHWVDVYRGDSGIALCDTYTSDVFFSQFE